MMQDFEPNNLEEIKSKAAGVDPEAYREQIRQLIAHVVSLLVDKPQDVTVTVFVGPKTTVYRVDCAKENMGQIIGTHGKTIMGLRAVVHAMTARIGIRSIIEIPV